MNEVITKMQVVKRKVLIETSEYKSMFKEDFTKIEKEILRLDGKIEVKFEQTKSDLIKWYVSLFVILALMIIGLYAKVK